jgi:membrane-associated protease RseP (regulator of RpoE activity)
MKKSLLWVLIVALAGTVVSARAGEKQDKAAEKQDKVGEKQDKAAEKQEKQPAPKQARKEPLLGVGVELIPPGLFSQLPGDLPKGQGVLVGLVTQNSPAAKAGLRPGDILLSYGDQKIQTPEQLVKLVRSDKPGREVDLSYVRAGKSMTSKVKLGERDPAADPQRSGPFPDERGLKAGSSFWDSFDEIKLTRTEGKQWRAEVAYRSKDGKKVSKTYSGTREEIRKAIQGERDLPANERADMLRALNLHDPVFDFRFPPGVPVPPIIQRP